MGTIEDGENENNTSYKDDEGTKEQQHQFTERKGINHKYMIKIGSIHENLTYQRLLPKESKCSLDFNTCKFFKACHIETNGDKAYMEMI